VDSSLHFAQHMTASPLVITQIFSGEARAQNTACASDREKLASSEVKDSSNDGTFNVGTSPSRPAGTCKASEESRQNGDVGAFMGPAAMMQGAVLPLAAVESTFNAAAALAALEHCPGDLP
jgi:hypothetical protein